MSETRVGPEAGYASSATLDEIASWLRTRRRVCVLTHTKPDGDAIGSTIGLVRTLRLIGGSWADPAHIKAWYSGPLPTWTKSIAQSDEFEAASSSKINENGVADTEPDAIVVLDTGSWNQLEHVTPLLRGRADRTVIVDHHLDGNPDVAERRFIDAKAAAVCVPVAELCRLLLERDSVTSLPAGIAEPLFLGIATDTGWFKHSNVDARALRTAADLMEAGADHSRLYRETEQRQRSGRLRLVGRALSGMELHIDDRLALLSVSAADVHETGVGLGDSGGLADYALAIEGVEVAAVLTEVEGEGRPLTKISMRSKSADDPIAVNEIVSAYGGGGHRQAAGARFEGTIEEAKKDLVRLVKEKLS